MQKDVLIIGAGAAGLEAGLRLREAGFSVLVLEARGEPGGRARSRGLNPVIARGAEFLHGESRLTRERLLRYGQPFYTLDPDFHVFEDERLRREPRYWEILENSFRRLHPTKRDRSFADFLRRNKVPQRERMLTEAFVEGFDAAELERVSANILAETKEQVTNPLKRQIGRPLLGFGPLMWAMAGELEKEIQYGTVVKEIGWREGEVIAHCESDGETHFFEARSAVVTLPVGVLKAEVGSPGAVRFIPEIPGFSKNLEKIEMGQAYRISLQFDREACFLLTKKFGSGLPFISSPTLDFSTWWSARPLAWPLITAWAGGEKALKVQALSRSERVELALENLGRMIGVRYSTLALALGNAHHHKWSDDPYSQGAYSYFGVGANEGARRFANGFSNTLYFAGEAFDEENGGTVEGALQSGALQAKKIISTHPVQRLRLVS